MIYRINCDQSGGGAAAFTLTRLPPESVRVRVVSFGQQTVSLLGPLHKRVADAVLQEQRRRIGNSVRDDKARGNQSVLFRYVP